ncbi:transferrin isoform X2 [Orussus abietinus]|uniref:transferrin isoform X1 n=1 Tax=Orussus abietinus TaxID=222816 RepID=UPI000625336C|nr:transferrin isoform X1 [Orussus abietinus]XP_012288842.1 transferrin isoform X2 [Orussus abietinus]
MCRKFLLAFVATLLTITSADHHAPVFTMCIPEKFWQECVEMMEDSSSKGIPISCISGRDRFECVEKVGRKEADVVAVDPEDMYLAAKSALADQAGYNVVEQIRTKEEPEEPYRYEAVAVVHKDLAINDVQGLRGLKSCHTGVGRNVGYKIPITKLTAMGVLGSINDPEYSARENELRALSSLFSKGCLVGTWSPDPAINQRLKETYSNMCALCEKPEVCDYPDIYSGYEGALRCLAHNGGEVAWTKVIYVKRFFGLPVGVTPAVPTNENPSEFRYFCPDGTKVPINAETKPCTWAARPWQGYMTNGGMSDVGAVQKELTELGKLGESEKAAWWKDLMLLDEKTLAVPATPVRPKEHLENSKYLDVIERNSGAPERNARWCVSSEAALSKCRALARAAFSRDARPRFDCIREKNEEECLKIVRDDGADLTILDGGSVGNAMNKFNAKPIIAEKYGEGSTKMSERPAVAIVKKGAAVNSLADLRGKRSCHSGYHQDFAGWTAPVHALKKSGLISSADDVAEFFSASCVPGAASGSKLCAQCVGNVASKDDRVIEATKCKDTEAEAFKGGVGALKCLISDKGDVAFLPLTALIQTVSERPDSADKVDLKTTDFQLVCPNGGLAAVEDWQNCNLGLEPPRVIVSSATKTVNALEELTHGVLAASSLYSKRPDFLQLFGSWGGEQNVMFKDDAKGLVSVDNSWDRWEQWATTKQEFV